MSKVNVNIKVNVDVINKKSTKGGKKNLNEYQKLVRKTIINNPSIGQNKAMKKAAKIWNGK